MLTENRGHDGRLYRKKIFKNAMQKSILTFLYQHFFSSIRKEDQCKS